MIASHDSCRGASDPESAPSASQVRPVESWFDLAVLPHEPALRAYLRRRYPWVSDPDDLIQETFLRAWKHRATIKSVRPFLFTTLRNTVVDLFRRRGKMVFVPLALQEEWRVPDPALTGPEQLVVTEKGRLLEAALGGLRPALREAVHLRLTHNLSCRQIADRLGITPKMAEHRISASLRRCRAFIAERGEPMGPGSRSDGFPQRDETRSAPARPR